MGVRGRLPSRLVAYPDAWVRAALSVEVVLCHVLRFVSREARAAGVRLSWFAVWRFEAMWGRGWHVRALAA